jgi:CO/xanthine dehydrogenase FAD-binding subunit
MIVAYHRPRSLDEALALLSRPIPMTLPLGGGTLLTHGHEEAIEVVDLQGLGLGGIQKVGGVLEVGATATLQSLLESGELTSVLGPALRLEAPLNLRNTASVAGSLVIADGRSTFATALLGLDAKLMIMRPQVESIALGDFLPARARLLPRSLVTAVHLPMNVRMAFEYVARTPADKPIVCVVAVRWPSGRTRLAVGGYGPAPLLAMDGTEADGVEAAARNAFHDAGDSWAPAEYRMDVGAALARRCMASLGA